ncbi:MAG TPA: 3-phosphoserine/phosphohydroxythreonine transaminase [Leptospiraceae bacterium]|nr:3-phosphoserine/phosphohydroxythreonine transaminase [Leptospiraceae bacterium]HMW08268.1 3-phosphoserine/phosphohydroxythreonine transaminase [Leptospiraceae bacterium]HMX35149.1 3-phosphoserine/phosphohydroxythreonine transaminase [Leptospiraceae bacterium]HMY34034.1 3-phosphoserine/phosphohydroxythreonine transaminase [Leptospiraceae bacterium]HMZ67147.1 3-phosphoserine/phosphohydroxythreonine transaminase [Leptospiraceae bacterium]
MNQIKNRVYNFNAGPAMLPIPVMEQAQREFLDYMGTGMSIMEMSHRGSHFEEILISAERTLRELLSIPENYSVIFYPGGATLQFSAIPLNLLKKGEAADFSLTGVWANKAEQEAKKLGFQTNIIYDDKQNNYTMVPNLTDANISSNAKYLHITSNNTIYGTRYKNLPKIKKVPVVADMTSDLLSRKINVSDFGIIFAGAQKNIGPSGLTIVIARNDLIESAKDPMPVLLNYSVMAKNKSIYNTPPTYSIYIARLVFDWCKKMGGVEKIEEINEEKAKILYNYLDKSRLYTCPVKGDHRSSMNVVFHLKDKTLEKEFIFSSEKRGIHGLPGHRDAGGFRASIYNAMPMEGVQTLIEFLTEFENKH